MRVKNALADENKWVLDGNYLNHLGEFVLPHLTAIFLLHYPWHVLLYRSLHRLKRRVFDRERLYSGNYQKFFPALMIVFKIFFWWKITRRHKRYLRYIKKYQREDLLTLVFHHPKEAEQFLCLIEQTNSKLSNI